jgi:hypothetical protein
MRDLDLGTDEEFRAALQEEAGPTDPWFFRLHNSSPAERAATIARYRARRAIDQSSPEWMRLVKAYRATGKPRPKLMEVAEQMGWASEQPLRDLYHRLGVARWHDVHALVSTDPD